MPKMHSCNGIVRDNNFEVIFLRVSFLWYRMGYTVNLVERYISKCNYRWLMKHIIKFYDLISHYWFVFTSNVVITRKPDLLKRM